MSFTASQQNGGEQKISDFGADETLDQNNEQTGRNVEEEEEEEEEEGRGGGGRGGGEEEEEEAGGGGGEEEGGGGEKEEDRLVSELFPALLPSCAMPYHKQPAKEILRRLSSHV